MDETVDQVAKLKSVVMHLSVKKKWRHYQFNGCRSCGWVSAISIFLNASFEEALQRYDDGSIMLGIIVRFCYSMLWMTINWRSPCA